MGLEHGHARSAAGRNKRGLRIVFGLTFTYLVVEGVAGVVGTHDLHVWSLTSGVNAMSVHVVKADGASHDDVLARVRGA